MASRTAGNSRSWSRSAGIPKFSTGATDTAAASALAMAALATDVITLRRPFASINYIYQNLIENINVDDQ